MQGHVFVFAEDHDLREPKDKSVILIADRKAVDLDADPGGFGSLAGNGKRRDSGKEGLLFVVFGHHRTFGVVLCSENDADRWRESVRLQPVMLGAADNGDEDDFVNDGGFIQPNFQPFRMVFCLGFRAVSDGAGCASQAERRQRGQLVVDLRKPLLQLSDGSIALEVGRGRFRKTG